MRADERLVALADLFKQRNALYGSNYLEFGKVMMAIFPKGLVLENFRTGFARPSSILEMLKNKR